MSSEKHVTKAAGVVGLATIATRISGFIRDMMIASALGAGMVADAYYVAFRIPNTLRRLVGEGALTIAFIPVFVEERQRSEADAWALANAVATFLTLILLVITISSMVFTPWIVRLIALGFDDIPEKFALTVRLTRMMFPYIFFISLGALAMGILNSLHHFFSPALAPLMLNLCLIGSVFWLSPHFDPPAIGLAIGVLLGGLMQFLFQLPALFRHGFRYRLSVDYGNPAVRKIGVLLLPALFGMAVYQLSVFSSTFLGSFLDQQGSITYLYYGNRLLEFPLGIFGVAIATAVLPTMSAYAANDDTTKLIDTLSFALRLMLFITFPATIGLIVLRLPIVKLLFEHGYFTPEASVETAQAVLYYMLGLPAVAGARIIVPVFYALKDTFTPVKCGAASLVVNIVCSLALMIPLQHSGLAFANSLSSIFYLGLLVWLLRRRLGPIGWRRIAGSAGKVLGASMIMGACCMPFVARAALHQWLVFPIIGMGSLVFLGVAGLLRVEELTFLKTLITDRKHAKDIFR